MQQDQDSHISFLDQIWHWLLVSFHWISEQCRVFMHWAFPNYMKFHDSALAAYKSHDVYYYLSLKWLMDFLSACLSKVAYGMTPLFMDDYRKMMVSILGYYHSFHLFGKIAIWMGVVFCIYISLFWGSAFLHFFRIKLNRLSNSFRYAKARYGTYLAIFKPKTAYIPDVIKDNWQPNDPNMKFTSRLFNLIFVELVVMSVIGFLCALVVIAVAYVVHYVGLIPLFFYPMVIAATTLLFKNIGCENHSGTIGISVGLIISFSYLLFTNFDLGFHGYIIDAVSYLLGFKKPIDFDPIFYTFFLYLGLIYLARYVLFYLYIEPMKVKRYKERGIDVALRYNKKLQKEAIAKQTKVSRRRIFSKAF